MSLNICMDCRFEKKRCQCRVESLVLIEETVKIVEDNMIKKIWNKVKNFCKRLMFWTR